MPPELGFVYFFGPRAVISENFLPGGREFDYLKKFPGVSPGGCWCLELSDALGWELLGYNNEILVCDNGFKCKTSSSSEAYDKGDPFQTLRSGEFGRVWASASIHSR